MELVGPGGLLSGLTKTVLETALEAEMTEHLGYDRHDLAGCDGGNSCNGTRAKTCVPQFGWRSGIRIRGLTCENAR